MERQWRRLGQPLHWVVFLTDISGLLGFLLELLEALAHFREHVEVHWLDLEVLGVLKLIFGV